MVALRSTDLGVGEVGNEIPSNLFSMIVEVFFGKERLREYIPCKWTFSNPVPKEFAIS